MSFEAWIQYLEVCLKIRVRENTILPDSEEKVGTVVTKAFRMRQVVPDSLVPLLSAALAHFSGLGFTVDTYLKEDYSVLVLEHQG
jgi:hypothetical protein